MCGGPTNIELKELDFQPEGQREELATQYAQTVFTGSPSGTVSFMLTPGTAGDITESWMGNHCVFSAGGIHRRRSHLQYNDNGPSTFTNNGNTIVTEDVNFSFPGNGWRTSGSARVGNSDLFEITFAP